MLPLLGTRGKIFHYIPVIKTAANRHVSIKARALIILFILANEEMRDIHKV
jgi:hypothetical protein